MRRQVKLALLCPAAPALLLYSVRAARRITVGLRLPMRHQHRDCAEAADRRHRLTSKQATHVVPAEGVVVCVRSGHAHRVVGVACAMATEAAALSCLSHGKDCTLHAPSAGVGLLCLLA